jgi:hypothetical protein
LQGEGLIRTSAGQSADLSAKTGPLWAILASNPSRSIPHILLCCPPHQNPSAHFDLADILGQIGSFTARGGLKKVAIWSVSESFLQLPPSFLCGSSTAFTAGGISIRLPKNLLCIRARLIAQRGHSEQMCIGTEGGSLNRSRRFF